MTGNTISARGAPIHPDTLVEFPSPDGAAKHAGKAPSIDASNASKAAENTDSTTEPGGTDASDAGDLRPQLPRTLTAPEERKLSAFSERMRIAGDARARAESALPATGGRSWAGGMWNLTRAVVSAPQRMASGLMTHGVAHQLSAGVRSVATALQSGGALLTGMEAVEEEDIPAEAFKRVGNINSTDRYDRIASLHAEIRMDLRVIDAILVKHGHASRLNGELGPPVEIGAMSLNNLSYFKATGVAALSVLLDKSKMLLGNTVIAGGVVAVTGVTKFIPGAAPTSKAVEVVAVSGMALRSLNALSTSGEEITDKACEKVFAGFKGELDKKFEAVAKIVKEESAIKNAAYQSVEGLKLRIGRLEHLETVLSAVDQAITRHASDPTRPTTVIPGTGWDSLPEMKEPEKRSTLTSLRKNFSAMMTSVSGAFEKLGTWLTNLRAKPPVAVVLSANEMRLQAQNVATYKMFEPGQLPVLPGQDNMLCSRYATMARLADHTHKFGVDFGHPERTPEAQAERQARVRHLVNTGEHLLHAITNGEQQSGISIVMADPDGVMRNVPSTMANARAMAWCMFAKALDEPVEPGRTKDISASVLTFPDPEGRIHDFLVSAPAAWTGLADADNPQANRTDPIPPEVVIGIDDTQGHLPGGARAMHISRGEDGTVQLRLKTPQQRDPRAALLPTPMWRDSKTVRLSVENMHRGLVRDTGHLDALTLSRSLEAQHLPLSLLESHRQRILDGLQTERASSAAANERLNRLDELDLTEKDANAIEAS